MPYPVRLETPRLILRRWRPEDDRAVARIWADPEVWAALRPGEHGDPQDVAAAGHAKQARHWETHGFGLWLVVPRESAAEEPVGWIGAWYPDFVPDLPGEIEIGWTLVSPLWGRGLATEGARVAAATAFEQLAPQRVISLIAPGNHRSAAVAGKLGMRHASDTTTVDGLGLRVFALPRAPAAEPLPRAPRADNARAARGRRREGRSRGSP